MKSKNLGLNAILNVIKQGLSVVFPLITYPYALRILGADGIGKVNYSSSIVKYFALLAMLGVTNYAIREGAKFRDNRNKFNQFINEVFSINVITTFIAYLLLAVTISLVPNFQNYRMLIMLQSISMILTTLGIDYVNTIHEDFLLITVRSIITHIISLVLLFLLVHTPADYYIYAMLSIVTNGIVCVSNLIYCRRYVHLSFTFQMNAKRHFKPMLILFANTIAIYIYVNVDTTMLGWIKGDHSVGLYTASVNVYSILKNILSAIYVVAVPRLANCIGNNDYDNYKKISTELFGYLILLLLPVSVGIICLAPEIMMFMGGTEFSDASLSLQILGVALIFAIFGGFITACINITLGKEKTTLLATLISATINFALNLIAIPRFSLYGAAITTLISEAFVFLFCFLNLHNRKELFHYKKLLRCIIDSSIGIVFIVLVTFIIDSLTSIYYLRIIMIFAISVPIYFCTLKIIKDPYILGLQNMLKSKMPKRRKE